VPETLSRSVFLKGGDLSCFAITVYRVYNTRCDQEVLLADEEQDMGSVDEVKSRTDIVELISGYVPLKKAGRNYKGLCPFHAEKTPSFVVFPDTQTWHCFGACGTGGDVFRFVMQAEGMDFSEALRELAQRAGVTLAPPTARSEAADKQREKLLEIHAAAAQYFSHLLRQSKEGAQAREYLAKRGINSETVERFQLGYALNTWEGLKSHLTGRGYTEADLIEAGLLVKKEETGSSYDRFRGRLIIPIRDMQGLVIGFGARALDPDDVPKYLNSPQTPLFDKSSTLFGLDLAKRAIRNSDQAVIVEGYMDVLSAHQRGHTNVIAGMGTALTEAQLKLLKRLTKNFILALDADTAGDSATLRGINLARESLDRAAIPVPTAQGLIRFEGQLDADIRIATLPPDRDPDDILRETPERWPVIIQEALPVIDFYLQVVSAQYDLTTAKGKSALVREVLPLLREIKDRVERHHHVGQLARLVKIDERALLIELDEAPRPVPPRRRPAPTVQPTDESSPDRPKHVFGLEEYSLAVMLGQPETLKVANNELISLDLAPVSQDDFQRTENQQLFVQVSDWTTAEFSPSSYGDAGGNQTLVEHLIKQGEPWLGSHLDFLLERWEALPSPPPETLAKDLVGRILLIRGQLLQEEVASLRFLQDEAEVSYNEEQRLHYQTLVNAAKEQLRLIHYAIDHRSILGRRRAEADRFGTIRV
jgi:DNA primase